MTYVPSGDHGDLDGLGDDDHSIYHNDTRGDARYYQQTEFISTSAGAGDSGKPVLLDASGHIDATMVNDADLTHNSLSGLTTGDPHTQYILVDGSRAFTGVVVGVDPTLSTHLATKGYVDTATSGVTWLEPVEDKDLTAPPGGPTTGDRYIVGASATGAWAGQDDDIAEWNGASWDFTTPSSGDTVLVIDESTNYRWNGTEWVNIGGAQSHSSLTNLSNDDHTQYHNNTRGDARYYQQTEFITTSAGAGDSGKPIELDASGHIDASMINDADIDHTNIGSIGTNTHAQIDTHIASTSNPHSVSKSDVSLGNVTDDAQLKVSSNLNDVANQQTAINNVTDSASGSEDDVLTVNATGDAVWSAITGIGESNTASNAGFGISLFYNKLGVDLRFNGILSMNDRLTVYLEPADHDIQLTVNEGNIVHDNLSGAGTNTHAQIDTHIADSTIHFTQASISITESQISDLSHTDSDAIHDNVASEISAVTEKLTPVNADLVIIEDSEDSNNKKRVQVGNLPGGGGGAGIDYFLYAYNAGVQQILSTNTVLTFDTEVIDDTPFTFTPGGSEVTVNDTANYTIDADMNVESREDLIIKFQLQIDTGSGFTDVPGAITYMGA